jgi:hypothetical protein
MMEIYFENNLNHMREVENLKIKEEIGEKNKKDIMEKEIKEAKKLIE